MMSTLIKRAHVHKFGGSSVGNAAAIQRVGRILRGESNAVAVVSALYGVTNRCEQLHAALVNGAHLKANEISREIIEHHVHEAGELQLGDRTLNEYTDIVRRTLLSDVPACGRTMMQSEFEAMVVSLGERLSAPLVAAHLNAAAEGEQGARSVCGEDIVVADNDGGSTMTVATRKRCEQLMNPNEILVVGGFACRTESGELRTLGRGGSDLSATTIGAAIGADEVTLWKVEGVADDNGYLKGWKQPQVQQAWTGVLSASPARLGNGTVRCIPQMSFSEAQEFCDLGKELLHPSTMKPVRSTGIPVHIRNTANCDAPGTAITACEEKGVLKGMMVAPEIEEFGAPPEEVPSTLCEDGAVIALVGADADDAADDVAKALADAKIEAHIPPLWRGSRNSLLVAIGREELERAEKVLHNSIIMPPSVSSPMAAAAVATA